MSFFIHFFKFIPNLVLIAIILLNFLEDPKDKFGILAAILGGFFLDIFSEKFFGFYVLIAILTSLFIKLFLKKYFQPVLKLKT